MFGVKLETMEWSNKMIKQLINRPHSIFCTCIQCEERERKRMIARLEEALQDKELIIRKKL